MTIVKGLKNINALVDKPKYEGTGSKVRWLKLADGQSVKIRFIEELDEDSANYSDSRGLALVVKEHTNPKDYKRRALDTGQKKCIARIQRLAGEHVFVSIATFWLMMD